MSQHVTISPNEAADRLAIRELVEAYAHCADRRDAKGLMALFMADTHFVCIWTLRIQNLHRSCTRVKRSLRCLRI